MTRNGTITLQSLVFKLASLDLRCNMPVPCSFHTCKQAYSLEQDPAPCKEQLVGFMMCRINYPALFLLHLCAVLICTVPYNAYGIVLPFFRTETMPPAAATTTSDSKPLYFSPRIHGFLWKPANILKTKCNVEFPEANGSTWHTHTHFLLSIRMWSSCQHKHLNGDCEF